MCIIPGYNFVLVYKSERQRECLTESKAALENARKRGELQPLLVEPSLEEDEGCKGAIKIDA